MCGGVFTTTLCDHFSGPLEKARKLTTEELIKHQRGVSVTNIRISPFIDKP